MSNGELLFFGYRVSVWEKEKVIEVDGGGGCRTMRIMRWNFSPING